MRHILCLPPDKEGELERVQALVTLTPTTCWLCFSLVMLFDLCMYVSAYNNFLARLKLSNTGNYYYYTVIA